MFDEEFLKDCYERSNTPMPLSELRQRLKHIASLCWGLSIDIQNELERNIQLKTENEALLASNRLLNSKLASYKRYLKSRSGRPVGRPKKVLSPEEEAERKRRRLESNRKSVEKYQAKKKAEKQNAQD